MRLLYTTTAYLPATGGAQVHLHQLAKMLIRQHQVQVVSQWDHNRTDWLLGTTLRAPRQAQDAVLDGVKVHRIGLSRREKIRLLPPVLLYYPSMHKALPRVAAALAEHLLPFARSADLIHNLRVGREGLSYASWQVARSLGIPFVFTPHHHPRWVGWRYRAYLDLYRQADLIIALTHTERDLLTQFGVRPDRIVVTGIGPVLAHQADGGEFRRANQICGPMVLFLGQHYLYKGYRQILLAAKRVWRTYPETHFVFIGPHIGHSSRELAEQADGRVLALGHVSLQTKTDALAACDILCVPSTQESFGGVYTEAWAMGKPVIGCPIPAVAEIIDDGVDGFLVPQESTEIAASINHLLAQPDLAAKMGAAGRLKVQSRYSWARLTKIYETAYQQLLAVHN